MPTGCRFDEDDQTVNQWLDFDEQIQRRIETVCEEGTARQTAEMVKKSKAGVVAGIENAIAELDERDREEFVGLLQRTLDSATVSSSTSGSQKTTIATLLHRIGLMQNGDARAAREPSLPKTLTDMGSSQVQERKN